MAELCVKYTMGGTQSAQPAPSCMGTFGKAKEFYIGATVEGAVEGATVGGCKCAIGGYFGGNPTDEELKTLELREYEASISAKTKEAVIRRLANALKRAGINVDPEGDPDEIVKNLAEQIPNPKNGQTFSKDANAQSKVCKTVADVLNDEFSPGVTKANEKFIDTSLGPVEICRSVGEWTHSFTSGINVEFLAVHASVKNTLRSVEILAEVMKSIYDKIKSKVEKSGDESFNRIFDPLHEVYIRAQMERKRQEELLKNILHVHLAPAEELLKIAMMDNSDKNALIKKLGIKPGTSEFGDNLAFAISGIGSAATIAQRVNKALKKVGLKMDEYVKSKEYKDFEALTDKKLTDIDAKDLAEFIAAIDVLRTSFNYRNDAKFQEAVGGALEDEEDKYRSNVDKRVDKVKTEKSLIIRDFTGRITRHYDEILKAVKMLGSELGKKIPITEKTDLLRDALVRMRDMREGRIELALVGFYSDANARERKENFLNGLRLVSSTCASLMELEMFREASPLFAQTKAAIDALEKTVDYFSDVIHKKFGGTGSATTGGAGDEDLVPEFARNATSLNEAVNEFTYFYYVSKVRDNLERSSKELDVFGEKYVELLGDAVAARLWHIRREKQAVELRLNCTDAQRVAGGAGNAVEITGEFPIAAVPRTPANEAVDKASDARLAAAKQWVAQEYVVKEKFYKALQAMDLYMKAFTSGIVKDPDAVRDIKKMLDGTQVIARWFSEETGENLWKAFECMDSINAAGNAVEANAHGAVAILDTSAVRPHYYDKVNNAIGVAQPPTLGVPQISIPANTATTAAPKDRAAAAKKYISDSLDYFQALKNLVNAFSRIGDKFGGRELQSQVFMSPTQIFKCLTDYMKHSAMSIHSGNDATQPVNLGVETQKADGSAASTTVADAVKPYQVYFGSVSENFGKYHIEDKYFVLIIKAMAAKILTTVGVYDMFERQTPIYDLTPTRFIVGGALESVPEAITGAAELYFRLPRLIEFYRGFLKWNGEDGGASLKISMLPELEGIFSGIIRLIFQKIVDTDNGDYSDRETQSIIREINAIHTHFTEKHSDRPVQAAMNAFITEINRRYGLIKREDMKNYWSMVRRTRNVQDYGSVNDTNYSILPGEGDNEIDRRAPSDRFTMPGAIPGADPTLLPRDFAGRPQLDDDISAATASRMMLREFRNNMEKEFRKIDRAQFGQVSYSLLIKQSEAEIKSATTSDAKLAIAMKLIQGSNIVSVDANKAYMFHETVIVGLNMVGAINSLLDNYAAQLELLNPLTIENAIMDGFHKSCVAGTAVPNPMNLATLTGGGAHAINTTIYDRYLFDGDSTAASTPADTAGQHLLFRSGTEETVGFNVIYEFIQLELAAPVAGGASRLPAPPSTYKTLEQYNALASLEQKRTLRAMRYFARQVVNYNLIMKDYIEMMFDLSTSSGGLVEVRFMQGSSTEISVNFSKLRDAAESMLNDVKYYIDMFRPFIPKATIDRFEKRGNPGSVFWLEEQLIDRRFRGTTDDPADQANTLDGLSRKTGAAFAALVRDTQVPIMHTAGGAMHINGNAATRLQVIPEQLAGNLHSRFESYGRALSEIVFYDASQQNSAQVVNQSNGIKEDYDLGTLIARSNLRNPTDSEKVIKLKSVDATAVKLAFIRRNVLYKSSNGMTRSRSLLFAFNQILARYLNTCSDISNNKLYLNLINAYANGVAAQSVATPSGKGYPDISVLHTAFGQRGDPKPDAILFQSLAYILQRLTKDVTATNISEYLITTLTDIPLFMKEKYRVNLPGFVRIFNLIVQKCEFIKQLVQKTTINCARTAQARLIRNTVNFGTVTWGNGGITAAAAANIDDIIWTNTTVVGGAVIAPYAAANAAPVQAPAAGAGSGQRAATSVWYTENALFALNTLDPQILAVDLNSHNMVLGKTSSDMKVRLVEILDSISSSAYTLSSSASEVLRELADQPIYMQTQESSIETYKIRYGKLPLMPLSASLYFLNDLGPNRGSTLDDLKLYPKVSLGEPVFKVQYGVRGLLIRQTPVEFDTMPGVKASLEAYNAVSAKREQIDPDRYLKFIKNVVASLRFFTEARNYKSMLSTSSEVFSFKTLIVANGAIVPFNPAASPVSGNASYAISKSDQEIVTLLESSNQEDEISKMTAVAGESRAGTGNNARVMERIFNLVDMNVIPINVHALMRDIPLANLYNYEYTFEQMVASLYGEMVSDYTKPGGLTDAETTETRKMFLRMLIDPYLNIGPKAAAPRSRADYAMKQKLYGSDVMNLGTAGFVHRMFRGDNNLGLGRPKFLSDQLFNKSLFGSTYQSVEDFDEAGPGVGVGYQRGRADANEQRGAIRAQLQAAMAAADDVGLISNMDAVISDHLALNTALTRNEVQVKMNLITRLIDVIAQSGAAVTNALVDADFVAGAPDAGTGIPHFGAGGTVFGVADAAPVAALLALARDAADAIRASRIAGAGDAVKKAASMLAQKDVFIAANSLLGRLTTVVLPTFGITDYLLIAINMRIRADINAKLQGAAALFPAAAAFDDLRLLVRQIADELVGLSGPANDTWNPNKFTRNTNIISYLKVPDDTNKQSSSVKEVALGLASQKEVLETIGMMRFDTKLVRNMFFITNILRVVRLKLNRDLTHSRNVVVSSHSAVAQGLTEFGSDPFGPNEVLQTLLPNGQNRFNDS